MDRFFAATQPILWLPVAIHVTPRQQEAAMNTQTDRMLRAPQVIARTGLSRSTIWRRVRAGTFPAPHEIGANSIGWLESSITAWIESRRRRTYAPKETAA